MPEGAVCAYGDVLHPHAQDVPARCGLHPAAQSSRSAEARAVPGATSPGLHLVSTGLRNP